MQITKPQFLYRLYVRKSKQIGRPRRTLGVDFTKLFLPSEKSRRLAKKSPLNFTKDSVTEILNQNLPNAIRQKRCRILRDEIDPKKD